MTKGHNGSVKNAVPLELSFPLPIPHTEDGSKLNIYRYQIIILYPWSEYNVQCALHIHFKGYRKSWARFWEGAGSYFDTLVRKQVSEGVFLNWDLGRGRDTCGQIGEEGTMAQGAAGRGPPAEVVWP